MQAIVISILIAAIQDIFSRLCIPSDYSAVTAALLMVDKNKFEMVHGLEAENLSVAFNDVDFCLKLIEQGFNNICLSQVEAYHYESKSRGKEDSREKKNRFNSEIDYMMTKWKFLLKNDPYYSPNLSLTKEDFSIKI